MISLSDGDWVKLRQILQRFFSTKHLFPDVKRGISQEDAGAQVGEMWVDSETNTMKIGVSGTIEEEPYE